ncbi:3034_t:CDS:1, partial [Acaulospora colombiana]
MSPSNLNSSTVQQTTEGSASPVGCNATSSTAATPATTSNSMTNGISAATSP